MATKAETSKVEAQRQAHETKARRAGGKASGTKPKRAKNRFPNPTSHNEAPRVAGKGVYELEPDATTRPPRKSTRRSPSHVKPDSPQRITAMNRNNAPSARAARGR